MEPNEKIADILRTDKDFVRVAAEKLGVVTGHNDVLARIVEENNKVIKDRVAALDIPETARHAGDLYNALIAKASRDEAALIRHFSSYRFDSVQDMRPFLQYAKDLANVGRGYFLKKEKALEFLEKEPPPQMLQYFGLTSVRDLLKRYDLFEIYCALRIVENQDWLNNTFFKQLERVTADDFEERDIEIRSLNVEWLKVAEKFLKKKYHNVSHLKELGVVFIIPIPIDIVGEVTRMFALVLHYFHEVAFYSKLFRKYALEEKTFARKLISTLRGDVLDAHFTDQDRGKKWMIIQRYLAKDDIYDWRLFEPHVNPEALHWSKAEDDIARLGEKYPDLGLAFWHHLDYIGDYFPDASGIQVLVSFNLVDTIMSLVQNKFLSKYLYHHQEAMWNKIFTEYVGREKMEEMIVDNLDKGYIDLG